MERVGHCAILLLAMAGLLPAKASGQGETTTAIVGEVRDTTNAAVGGATVTIANHETGLSALPRLMRQAASTFHS